MRIAAADVPPLDPDALRAAIAGLPNDEASALLQVRGRAGSWQGTSGVANVHTGQPSRWTAGSASAA